jgi:serine/threonine-protein kinase
MSTEAPDSREGTTDAGGSRARASRPGSIVAPGDVVGGRYVVEEVLGSGGMGVVVAARHELIGHRVAMKFVSAATSANAEAFVRFSREARIVASLESDHVVRVTDFGMHAGTPYMVMELLMGRDLSSELSLRGSLPVAEAVDYVIQACAGLSSAHAKGIVHRDVKLANLFLATRADGDRVVKVLDFGVSKLSVAVDDDVSLTCTSTMIGSPLFMSPEQIRDPRRVDLRADVWSLGIVLSKLLTGQAPFPGQSATALCAAIAADAPLALRAQRPELPRELETVVLRCLEKGVARRYPSAVALARDLAPFASMAGKSIAGQLVDPSLELGAPESPVEGTPREPEAQTTVMDSVATVLDTPDRASRTRHVVGWGVVATLAIAAVTGAVLLRSLPTAGQPVSALPSQELAVPPSGAPSSSPWVAEPAPTASASGLPALATTARSETPPPARAAQAAPRRRPPRPVPAPRAPAPTSRFGGAALDDHY